MGALRRQSVEIGQALHAPAAARQPGVVNRERAGVDAEVKRKRVDADSLHIAFGHQHMRRLAVEAGRVVLARAVPSREAGCLQKLAPSRVHRDAAAFRQRPVLGFPCLDVVGRDGAVGIVLRTLRDVDDRERHDQIVDRQHVHAVTVS